MSFVPRPRQLLLAALMAAAITVLPLSAGADPGNGRSGDNASSAAFTDHGQPAGVGVGRKGH
jgi:hypothetical protein